jgi:hypothetical protein
MSKIISKIPRDTVQSNGRRSVPVVECDCGTQVKCFNAWANQCQCGLEYNGGGQQLAHRSQWGEETGESF